MAEPQRPAKMEHKKNRLEAFSDGVFAIAITLMVLEIAIPVENGEGTHLLSGLAHEWPVYLTYFVSFMTIGAVWIEHSAMVDALDHIDGVFMRLNLVLLLFCAFLPFPTRLMSEFAGDIPGERVAVVFYGAVLLMMTVMLLVMGRHAENEGLFGDDFEDERKRRPGSSTNCCRASSPTSPAAPWGCCRRRSASSSTCSSRLPRGPYSRGDPAVPAEGLSSDPLRRLTGR